MAMLGFSIRKAFYDGWDHILSLAAMNTFYVLLFLAFYLAGGTNLETHTTISLILLSLIVLVYCIYSIGVYRNAYAYGKDLKSDIKGFFSEIKKRIRYGLFHYLITMLILVGTLVVGPAYLSLGSLMGYFTGTLVLWVALAVFLAMQYYYPLCFYCPEKGPLQIFKLCFAFFLDNFGYTLFLMLRTIFDLAVSVLSALLVPGLAGIAVSRTTMVRLLIIRYEYLDNHIGMTKKQVDWEDILFDEMERTGKRSLLDMVFPRRHRDN